MRTTIANRFSDSLTSIQRHARQLADEQVRLSGGTRLLKASDSALTMGKAVDLRTTQAQLDSLGRLQSFASNRMDQVETALKDAGKVLDDLYQVYLISQNASLGEDQLKGLGVQAGVLQEELEQVLLRRDSSGYRIFNVEDLKVIVDGGTAGVEPVSINSIGRLGGDPEKVQGLNPLFTQAVGDKKAYWEGVKTEPQINTAVKDLVYGRENIAADYDQNTNRSFLAEFVHNLQEGKRLESGRPELREASRALVQQQMGLGASQARIERSIQRTEDHKLSVLSALSNEIDTDFAASTMEVQKARALLDAAQAITAQIGSMNLFQKLG
jgi:flagellin-like hook-associated protein FlgL